MTTKKNHSTGVRQGIKAALFLALAFAIPQSARAQSQWATSGNNIYNTNTGNVGIGTAIPMSTLHVASASTATSRGVVSSQHTDDTNAALYSLLKSRGTIGSPLAVVNGDNIGNLYSSAYDGTSYVSGGRIRFTVDGTVTTGSVPTAIQFLTGLNANLERMRITSNGNIGIGTTSPTFLLDVVGTNNAPFRVRDISNREYFSTTTRSGTYATVPIVSLGGSRLIIDADSPEGGNSTVLRRFVNSLIVNPSDHPNYPGALLVRQLGGENILFVDQNTNGRVGIGTVGPSFKLDVQGGQINASAGLCIAGDCRSAWSQVGGGGSSQWITTGANISYSSGNVGIGTTAPTSRLQVIGDVSASGTISAGNVVAKYQDIAEWVPSRSEMPAGTVVVLDTDQLHYVLASSQPYDTRVAGVVTERPGVILGESAPGKVMVATTGRVRVKVDATRAPIRAGDILVTSDLEGIAMRSEPIDLGGARIHRPGTIIGKALEPLAKGTGEILVLLTLQ